MRPIVLVDIVVDGDQVAVNRRVEGRSAERKVLREKECVSRIGSWLEMGQGDAVHVRLRPLHDGDFETALELAVGLGWLGVTVGLVSPARAAGGTRGMLPGEFARRSRQGGRSGRKVFPDQFAGKIHRACKGGRYGIEDVKG